MEILWLEPPAMGIPQISNYTLEKKTSVLLQINLIRARIKHLVRLAIKSLTLKMGQQFVFHLKAGD